MNDLQTFTSDEFNLVVTPHDDDGFRVQAPGLARALGFAAAKDMLRSIPDEEKGWETAPTPGGEQRVGYVTEAGFYRALGQRQPSRITDSAVRSMVERFQTWVYRDVLPALRKAGRYEVAPQFEIPPTYADALELAARQARELEAAKEKVDAFDAFLNGKGVYLIDTVANLIGTKHRALWKLLYEEKILIGKGSRKRQPYAQKRTEGWFEVKTHPQERTNGHAATTTYVTPYGCEQIRLLAIKRELIQPQLLALTGGAS